MSILTHKKCSKCGEVKAISEFTKDKYAKSGYVSACKLCRSLLSRVWRKENPEKYREVYKNNNRKYYAEHKEESREYNRKWVASNIEHAREGARNRNRKYREIHADEIQKRRRAAYAENPERHLEAVRKHKSKNPNVNRIGELKRKYGLTLEQYEEMHIAQGGVCKICGKSGNKKNLCVDHNHQTGEVRGLLCTKCNAAIGGLDDSVRLLERAIKYLKGEC